MIIATLLCHGTGWATQPFPVNINDVITITNKHTHKQEICFRDLIFNYASCKPRKDYRWNNLFVCFCFNKVKSPTNYRLYVMQRKSRKKEHERLYNVRNDTKIAIRNPKLMQITAKTEKQRENKRNKFEYQLLVIMQYHVWRNETDPRITVANGHVPIES